MVDDLARAYLDEGLTPRTACDELDEAERALVKLLSNLAQKYRARAELALVHVRNARRLLRIDDV